MSAATSGFLLTVSHVAAFMRAISWKQGSAVTPRRRSEKQIVEELEAGREHLLSAPASRRLLSLLRQRLQSITRNIYIIRCIPEQTEELYDILVDGATVVHIELPRDASSAEIVFETSGIKEYLGAHSHITKPNRRRLELALQLAQR
ncbi:hypothetical protein FJN17_14520 [Bradyrhizobium symbiodeficiens]|uniref:DUF1499 domain-containing protein n=1 Tax=Bradyrhizobium symbiodeficiens TaxID=1404367 RepID=A0ABX5W5U5_9BRAD|nr:hypothetical protein [Bradyrhizobium symbiodeficiens]QDF38674.1 hypothetical protein FJN17_14520 [Bradyrhizobium symbiodeficiens]